MIFHMYSSLRILFIIQQQISFNDCWKMKMPSYEVNGIRWTSSYLFRESRFWKWECLRSWRSPPRAGQRPGCVFLGAGPRGQRWWESCPGPCRREKPREHLGHTYSSPSLVSVSFVLVTLTTLIPSSCRQSIFNVSSWDLRYSYREDAVLSKPWLKKDHRLQWLRV